MRWLNKTFIKTPISVFLALLILLSQTGCIQYYRVSDIDYPKSDDTTTEDLYRLKANYFFVHIGDKVFQLKDVKYWKNGDIQGQIIPVKNEVLKLYNAALKKQNGVVHKKSSVPGYQVKQIHFYASNLEKSETNLITIKSEDLEKVHLLHNHDLATVAASTGVTLAVTTVALGVLLLIACQCPHIYTEDGSQHVSNAFVGSVSKNLEQDDFIKVEANPDAETIFHFVNEEESESHFFNEVKLLKVEHEKNTWVLPDPNGGIHVLSSTQESTEAALSVKGDGASLMFDNIDPESNLATYELTFDKPSGYTRTTAKLVLRVKNSSWASYVIDQWYGLFGSKVSDFRDNVSKKPTAKQFKWQKEQGMTLSVYSKNNYKWDFQNDIKVVGNTVYRDLVIPIVIDETTDKISVKLTAGFKLWDIDYLGLDYSDNEIKAVEEISPVNLNSSDFALLNANDEGYLSVSTNDTLTVNFGNLDLDGYSYVLKVGGYYTKDVEGIGEMKKGEVMSFKKKGQMSRFSYHLYQEALSNLSDLTE